MSYDRMVSGLPPGLMNPEPESTEGTTGEVTSPRPSQNRGDRMRKPLYPIHSYPWYITDWRQSRTRMRLARSGA